LLSPRWRSAPSSPRMRRCWPRPTRRAWWANRQSLLEPSRW